MQIIGEVWYNRIRLQGTKSRVTYNRLVQVDEPFDTEIGFVAAVLALFGGAVHECVVRANEIGAYLPLLWIVRNLAKEDQDRITSGKLEFLAFNSGSPFVESTIWRAVVRLVVLRVITMLRTVAMARMACMRAWMTRARRWGGMISARMRDRMRHRGGVIAWYSPASSGSRIWLRNCCQGLLLCGLGRGLRSGRNYRSSGRLCESCDSTTENRSTVQLVDSPRDRKVDGSLISSVHAVEVGI